MVRIHQESSHLHPIFKLLSAHEGDSDRQLAAVKKESSCHDAKFNIDSVNGEYILLNIDTFSHELQLANNIRVVATVDKHVSLSEDSYGVQIACDEDHALIIALIIVLDQVIYDKKDK